MIHIMRKNLNGDDPTSCPTSCAGYESVNVSTLVDFLDHYASEEAFENGLEIQEGNLSDWVPFEKTSDKRYWERTLLDFNKNPIVLYYLDFRQDTENGA